MGDEAAAETRPHPAPYQKSMAKQHIAIHRGTGVIEQVSQTQNAAH